MGDGIGGSQGAWHDDTVDALRREAKPTYTIPARLGSHHLGDVLYNGLRELGATDEQARQMSASAIGAPDFAATVEPPDLYAHPDAMVYLPARAFAALSNALALMVRHAIDDRETLGQLAEARNADAERLDVLEASLRDIDLSFTQCIASSSRIDDARYTALEKRVGELGKRPAPRTRKAA
jgi:hypothetical protein